MHDEKFDVWYDLLQRQEDYITGYIEFCGYFDNTTLANNIIYLVKKNNMYIGELEQLIGISTGYISRTIKKILRKI